MSEARRVLKHEQAKRSLEAVAEYLAREASVDVALRFLARAEETFAFLLGSPGVGHAPEFRSLELASVLAWHISEFENWLVYYREIDDGIVVLDVIHGARDLEARLSERFEPDE